MLSCFLLATIPFILFDKVHMPVLAAIELAVFPLLLLANRGYRPHLWIFILSLPVFFTAGEVYFRLRYLGPDGLSFTRYRPAGYGHPLSMFEYDEGTYTGLKPHSSLVFRGNRLTINSAGFRGRDFTAEKPDGVYRIVLAGASVTFGTGLADDDVMTSLLERKLNAAGLPKRVEFINLSIGGNRFGEMLDTLRAVGATCRPDLVMFLANETLIPLNDMVIRPRKVHKVDVPIASLVMNRRYNFFGNALFFSRLIEDFRSGRLGVAPDEDAGKAQRHEGNKRELNLQLAIGELKELRAKTGAAVALYLIKPLFNLQDPTDRIAYRDRLLHLARENGFYCFDTYQADYSGYKPLDLMVYPGDKHPNEIAHRLYAESIYPGLLAAIREQLNPARSGPGTE